MGKRISKDTLPCHPLCPTNAPVPHVNHRLARKCGCVSVHNPPQGFNNREELLFLVQVIASRFMFANQLPETLLPADQCDNKMEGQTSLAHHLFEGDIVRTDGVRSGEGATLLH